MKRVRFGAALLVLLLALSIAVTICMGRTHTAISEALGAAAEDFLTDRIADANEKIAWARRMWEEKWRFSAAFADHDPMEEIDGLFCELDVYVKTRDYESSAAICARLSRAVEAMGDAHECSWWNLL